MYLEFHLDIHACISIIAMQIQVVLCAEAQMDAQTAIIQTERQLDTQTETDRHTNSYILYREADGRAETQMDAQTRHRRRMYEQLY